jgi:hypothetical protein
MCASVVAAGCYDSTESRPRDANALHSRQTEYGSENPANTGADTTQMPASDKGFKGENPKTGKP